MNARQGQGSNKQLVPLVKQDYANQSRGLFEAQFSSAPRPSDLSSINYQHNSSVGESRLEFSKFLMGTQKRQTYQVTGKLDASDTLQLSRTATKTALKAGKQIIRSETDRINSKVVSLASKTGLNRPNVSRDVSIDSRKPMIKRKSSSESSHEDQSRSGSSERPTAGKVVDINTYIKEQRKIIKRVKSGSRIATGTSKIDKSIQYEIKEFTRANYDEENQEIFNRNSFRQSQPHISKRATNEKFMKQFGSTGLIKSRNTSSTKAKLSYIIQGSQFDRFSHYKTQGDEPGRKSNNEDDEIQKLRERLEQKRANRSAAFSTKNYSSGMTRIKSDHLEKSMTFEEALYNKQKDKPHVYGSDDITQETLNTTYRQRSAIVQGKLHLPSDLSKEHITGNEQRTKYLTEIDKKSQNNFRSSKNIRPPKPMSANPANYKSSEILLIGDSDQNQSLASHFMKKVSKDDTMHFFEGSKNKKSPSITSKPRIVGELSKLDLRKKMMEYGKRTDKSKTPAHDSSKIDIMPPESNMAAQSNQSLVVRRVSRNASPRPEVLERLARGIKPKVEKSEIHEITRRHIEKFSKLGNQGESPTSNQLKKADLMERRLKVKELDKVG